jgi:DNA end-binding protein Ku
MFYANEVRSYEEIDTGATYQFKDVELNLAENLIAQLSQDAFDPSRYKDEYASRVLAAVDQKVAGEQVHVAAEVPKAQVIDLFEALKQSLEQAQAGAGAAPKTASAKGPVKAGNASVEDAEDGSEGAEEDKPRPVKKATPRKTRGRKAS